MARITAVQGIVLRAAHSLLVLGPTGTESPVERGHRDMALNIAWFVLSKKYAYFILLMLLL